MMVLVVEKGIWGCALKSSEVYYINPTLAPKLTHQLAKLLMVHTMPYKALVHMHTQTNIRILMLLTQKIVHLALYGLNHTHTWYPHPYFFHFDLHNCIFTKNGPKHHYFFP